MIHGRFVFAFRVATVDCLHFVFAVMTLFLAVIAMRMKFRFPAASCSL